MSWQPYGVVTLVSLTFISLCLPLCLHSLMLQGTDYILLVPQAPLSQASVFCLVLRFVGTGMYGCALLTQCIANNETCSAAEALRMNCIPKHDKCLHF